MSSIDAEENDFEKELMIVELGADIKMLDVLRKFIDKNFIGPEDFSSALRYFGTAFGHQLPFIVTRGLGRMTQFSLCESLDEVEDVLESVLMGTLVFSRSDRMQMFEYLFYLREAIVAQKQEAFKLKFNCSVILDEKGQVALLLVRS